MEIEIVDKTITKERIKQLAQERQSNMIKAVVDIKQKLMAVGGELHSDEEALLLEHGSLQDNLWGINFWPNAEEVDFIEFDSMINLRPGQGNRSRGVEDPVLREEIKKIVHELCT